MDSSGVRSAVETQAELQNQVSSIIREVSGTRLEDKSGYIQRSLQ